MCMKRLSMVDAQEIWVLSYHFSIPSVSKVTKRYIMMENTALLFASVCTLQSVSPGSILLLTVLRRWSRCCSYSVQRGASCWSCPALCLCVSSVLLAFWSPCAGKRELVFVLIVHLIVSYAHVNLWHFFSSSWCQVCCNFCLWLFLDVSVDLFVFSLIWLKVSIWQLTVWHWANAIHNCTARAHAVLPCKWPTDSWKDS